MTEPDHKMLYIATAQLLCEVHHKLTKMRSLLRTPDAKDHTDESLADQMERFKDGFNRCGLTVEIASAGGDAFAIFQRG